MNVGDEVILPESFDYAVKHRLISSVPSLQGIPYTLPKPKFLLKTFVFPTTWEVYGVVDNFSVQLLVHTANIKPIKKEEVLLD